MVGTLRVKPEQNGGGGGGIRRWEPERGGTLARVLLRDSSSVRCSLHIWSPSVWGSAELRISILPCENICYSSSSQLRAGGVRLIQGGNSPQNCENLRSTTPATACQLTRKYLARSTVCKVLYQVSERRFQLNINQISGPCSFCLFLQCLEFTLAQAIWEEISRLWGFAKDFGHCRPNLLIFSDDENKAQCISLDSFAHK